MRLSPGDEFTQETACAADPNQCLSPCGELSVVIRIDQRALIGGALRGVPMSTADLRRSAWAVLNVALVAVWFFALFAVGAAIAGLLI